MNQKNINKMTRQNTLNVNDGPQNCVNVLEGQSNLLAGGSIASDLVNQLSPKDCCTLLPNKVLDILTKDFVIANYGTSFKTTGGGKGFSLKFINNIISNLKHKLSIENILQKMRTEWNKNNNYKLNEKNSKNILNDLLVSNPSLQSSNISKVYQGGARTVLPLRWFRPDFNYPNTPQNTNMKGLNCPCPRTLPEAYNNINFYPYYRNSCTMNMKGGQVNPKISNPSAVRFLPWNQDTNLTGFRITGDSIATGATIPISPIQRINNHLNGTDPIFAPNKGDITNTMGAQFQCENGNCSPDVGYMGNDKLINPSICVRNFDHNILSESPVNDNPNSTPADTYNGPLWDHNTFYPKVSPPHPVKIPNQRAGSRKNLSGNNQKNKKKSQKK